MNLEIHHGLDINSSNHIWLLHYLFLQRINEQLEFFTQAWNHHSISMRNSPSRSPADMFGFDMLVHGVRGYQLPTPDDDPLNDEELEVFGLDWEALHSDAILQSRDLNNRSEEGEGSWIGRSGPPENLNQVDVDPPSGVFTGEEIHMIDIMLISRVEASGDDGIAVLWTEALAIARIIYSDMF